jgi:hypothetical protein
MDNGVLVTFLMTAQRHGVRQILAGGNDVTCRRAGSHGDCASIRRLGRPHEILRPRGLVAAFAQ